MIKNMLLKRAIRSGDAERVKSLLGKPGDRWRADADQIPLYEGSLLHMCLRHSPNAEIIRALLDAGADPNIIDGSRRPLQIAIERGFERCAAALARRSPPDNDEIKALARGESASMLSSVFEGMKEGGVSPPNLAHFLSEIALISARDGYQSMALKSLSLGADPDATYSGGETLLGKAVETENAELLSALIAAGADLRKHGDTGLTALEVARKEGKDGLVRILESAMGPDAQNSPPLFSEKKLSDPAADAAALPDLHLAIRQGHEDLAVRLAPLAENIDERGPGGRTALMEASERGMPKAIEALLLAGADPDAQDDLGWTPRKISIAQGHLEASERLVLASLSKRRGQLGGPHPVEPEESSSVGIRKIKT